jgi:hypothetical protein
MAKAVKITTWGDKEVVEFNNSTSYNVLREAVGGWIEQVWFDEYNFTLWVNEEGKLEGLPQNPIATALWVDEYDKTDVVVGNVIITGGADDDGNTLGLTDEQVEFLLAYDKRVTYPF